MVDFKNASFVKMSIVNTTAFPAVYDILVPGEEIVSCYKSIRDGVVFTNKRIISINVQGMTGKKKDFTSLPYSKIQAFSVETAGAFDLDCELDVYFSTIGQVRFEFSGRTDIQKICKVIGEYVL